MVDAVVVSSWSFFKRLDGAGGGHFPRILAKFETWLTCSEAFVAFVTSLAVDFCKPLWLLAAFFLAKKAAAVVCWSFDPVQRKKMLIKFFYSAKFSLKNENFLVPFIISYLENQNKLRILFLTKISKLIYQSDKSP